MLGITEYCAKSLKSRSLKVTWNDSTWHSRESRLVIIRDHWKWHHSIASLRVSYWRFIVTMALSGIISGIKRDIFSYPLHSTSPSGRSPSEYCHNVWCAKTRLVCLPYGEKKFENMFTRFDTIRERDRHPDGRTDTARRHSVAAVVALIGCCMATRIFICIRSVVSGLN